MKSSRPWFANIPQIYEYSSFFSERRLIDATNGCLRCCCYSSTVVQRMVVWLVCMLTIPFFSTLNFRSTSLTVMNTSDTLPLILRDTLGNSTMRKSIYHDQADAKLTTFGIHVLKTNFEITTKSEVSVCSILTAL